MVWTYSLKFPCVLQTCISSQGPCMSQLHEFYVMLALSHSLGLNKPHQGRRKSEFR